MVVLGDDTGFSTTAADGAAVARWSFLGSGKPGSRACHLTFLCVELFSVTVGCFPRGWRACIEQSCQGVVISKEVIRTDGERQVHVPVRLLASGSANSDGLVSKIAFSHLLRTSV